MKRNSLLSMLDSYKPDSGIEENMYLETVEFVKENPDCFERSLLKGHITASGWVLSADQKSVLLMHHSKLDRWFQPGGHCDGDPAVEEVARKEVWEETGIKDLTLLKDGIYDIDIHLIPERKDVPEHYHYDIRFVYQAFDNESIVINSESKDVQWVPLEEVKNLHDSESIMRMVRKVSAL